MYISVIIPSFNASKFIIAAIESCLIQQEVGEIIVIDDNSSDNTYDLVERYGNARVLLLRNEKRKGPGFTRNKGLMIAKFPYISFLDADDYFLQNRFTENIQFLEKTVSIDGTYEVVKNFIESEAKVSTEHNYSEIGLFEKVSPEDLFKYICKDTKSYFSIISLLIRNKNSKNFLFDIDLTYGQDIDYIYQISLHLKLKNFNKATPKILRRLHSSNHTSNADFVTFNAREKILFKWYKMAILKKLPFMPSLFLIYRMASYQYMKIGNKSVKFSKFHKIFIACKLFIIQFLYRK